MWGLHDEKDYIKLLEKFNLKVVEKKYFERPIYLNYEEFMKKVIKHSQTVRRLKSISNPEIKALLENEFKEILERVRKFGYKKSKVMVIIAKKEE